MNAKQIMEEGTKWTAVQARYALPFLLLLVKTGQTLTYKDLTEKLLSNIGDLLPPFLLSTAVFLKSLVALSTNYQRNGAKRFRQ